MSAFEIRIYRYIDEYKATKDYIAFVDRVSNVVRNTARFVDDVDIRSMLDGINTMIDNRLGR